MAELLQLLREATPLRVTVSSST